MKSVTRVLTASRVAVFLAAAIVMQSIAAEAQCPEVGKAAAQIAFREGFSVGPIARNVTAGGNLDLGKCASVPGTGWVTKLPDFVLNYKTKNNGPSAFTLTFRVDSSADTVLLINGPDGKWHYNDDGGRALNARLSFERAAPGRYDVWVGSYSNRASKAKLTVTEDDPPALKSGPPVLASPKPLPAFKVIGVHFGTDRKQQGPPDRPSFGSERAQKLTVGRVLVTIPRTHKIGVIERPWEERWLGIDLGRGADPTRFFTMHSIAPQTASDFLRDVRERLSKGDEKTRGQAFVFVHGYNVSFEYAAYRAAQLTHDLDFAGVPFFYSWPSAGGITGYIYDEDSARLSEGYLREFMDRVLVESGSQRVHLIAHSMGSVPLLRVLAKLAQEPNRPRNIGQVILAAPDFDWQEFNGLASSIFATKLATTGFTTLYASASDRALQKAAEVRRGTLRAGQVPATGPLVVRGVQTIDVTATNMDILSVNHSAYAESREIINDLIGIFKGVDQPKTRTPLLREIQISAGTYWQFPR